MYRKTKRAIDAMERYSKMGVASQAKQEKNRVEAGGDVDLWSPPAKRRVIKITDYDFGEVTHVMELRRSDRLDCYDCYVNGELWKSRIGWSRVLEWVRKAFPRVVNV